MLQDFFATCFSSATALLPIFAQDALRVGARIRCPTVVFGVSRAFWLGFGCLAITGMADTVSMVFRNLIRQLETPDHLAQAVNREARPRRASRASGTGRES